MEPLNNLMCPGPTEAKAAPPAGDSPGDGRSPSTFALLAAALGCWFLLYRQLQPLADLITFELLGLPPHSRLTEATRFFLYDTPKVLMLLALIVFAVGVLRSFFTPERTRRILAGKRESTGNVLAALLGIVTPFCSCSAVPLFIGFVTAGVPLGVTFSFLIAAPMVNEIAVVLLYGLLGWKIALLYLATGLGIAILAGFVIGRFRLEKFVEPWVFKTLAASASSPAAQQNWVGRIRYGRDAMREIVAKVWIYVVLAIAVGAAIHGYVPEGYMAGIMGRGAWWSVPVAVVVGIPMYANAASIVPIIHALLEKGAALGTVLAFMMSVIALSLPEMVILRKVLQPFLIAVFVGVVGTGILLVGFLFNMII